MADLPTPKFMGPENVHWFFWDGRAPEEFTQNPKPQSSLLTSQQC